MTAITLDPISVSDDTAPPDITTLTTKSISGTGVFDILMASVKEHLMEEFDADRLSGSEYSQVYLGALTAVLQQANTFLLNHQSERKISADIGLIRQKTVTELASTDDYIPPGLAFNDDTSVTGLVKAEIDYKTKQGDLVDMQVDSSETEKALIGQKIITELAQTDTSTAAARLAGYGFNDSDIMEGIAATTISKMNQDIAASKAEEMLITQKVVTELAQTCDTKDSDLGKGSNTTMEGIAKVTADKIKEEKILITQKQVTELAQTSYTKPETLGLHSDSDIGGSIDAAILKLTSERALLNQKSVTEQAQTTDLVSTTWGYTRDTMNGIDGGTVAGVLGAQKLLYTAQTGGYSRDAEQKLAKIMVDAWSVENSLSKIGTEDTGLINTELAKVLYKAKQGIGVAPASM